MFCAAFNGILITGTLITITLLFLVFVDNGLQAAGMGGLVLSLIPSLAVFAIGIFVNKKSLRSTIISTFLGGEQNTSTNDGGNSGDKDIEAQYVLVNEPQNTSTNNGCDIRDGDEERQPLLQPRP